MKALRSVSSGTILLALAIGGLAAEQVPEEHAGPKVGSKAPAFTLKDQNGQEHTLRDFLKKGNVGLVFYRSSSW